MSRKNRHSSPRLYGFHAVREAWLNPERTVQNLYITTQALKGFEATIEQAKRDGLKRPHPDIVEKDNLTKILPKGAVHQGIALCCSDRDENDVQDFIIRAKTRPDVVLCILDQVTDPHNVGAILRSASAFGIDGIIAQKKHAPALEGVLAKTACGAVDHIDVASVTNLARTIEDLQDHGFYVLGLDERGEETIGECVHSLRSQDNGQRPLVCVLGSEGEGLRHLIKEKCDQLVKLPTQGAIASLNVSNAAAVTFYALKVGG